MTPLQQAKAAFEHRFKAVCIGPATFRAFDDGHGGGVYVDYTCRGNSEAEAIEALFKPLNAYADTAKAAGRHILIWRVGPEVGAINPTEFRTYARLVIADRLPDKRAGLLTNAVVREQDPAMLERFPDGLSLKSSAHPLPADLSPDALETVEIEIPDRFVSPCPPPTPYQREITEVLIEEAAEVIQRGTKLLRFGVAEIEPGQFLQNCERLSEEVGDFLETVEWAKGAGVLVPQHIEIGRMRKRVKLRKYLQHQPDQTS